MFSSRAIWRMLSGLSDHARQPLVRRHVTRAQADDLAQCPLTQPHGGEVAHLRILERTIGAPQQRFLHVQHPYPLQRLQRLLQTAVELGDPGGAADVLAGAGDPQRVAVGREKAVNDDQGLALPRGVLDHLDYPLQGLLTQGVQALRARAGRQLRDEIVQGQGKEDDLRAELVQRRGRIEGLLRPGVEGRHEAVRGQIELAALEFDEGQQGVDGVGAQKREPHPRTRRARERRPCAGDVRQGCQARVGAAEPGKKAVGRGGVAALGGGLGRQPEQLRAARLAFEERLEQGCRRRCRQGGREQPLGGADREQLAEPFAKLQQELRRNPLGKAPAEDFAQGFGQLCRRGEFPRLVILKQQILGSGAGTEAGQRQQRPRALRAQFNQCHHSQHQCSQGRCRPEKCRP
jgi:hypothetical protein